MGFTKFNSGILMGKPRLNIRYERVSRISKCEPLKTDLREILSSGGRNAALVYLFMVLVADDRGEVLADLKDIRDALNQNIGFIEGLLDNLVRLEN